MWQVAVAAAVAGSGLLAKQLFSPNAETKEVEEEQALQISNNSTSSPLLSQQLPKIPPVHSSILYQSPTDHCEPHEEASVSPICERGEEKEGDGGNDDGIFRFSSSGSRSNSEKSQVLVKKKTVSGVRRRGKILGRFDNACSDQRKGGGKRVSVCLKRRKTGRSFSGKHHSSCSKDCSSFGWGLGLGMIYMMSAGRAEVSKLSRSVDKTAKVVHELRSDLHKQESSQLFENVLDATNTTEAMQKLRKEKVTMESCTTNKPQINMKDVNHLADSEYASSVLTEEQQPEGAEMDQLGAELESELQKLHWCAIETSTSEGNVHNSSQIEIHKSANQSSTGYQSGGVSPTELKNKLSHLLIKQQEGHILELESELNLAYSKLQEKETELRALKDCVRHLTELSLSTVSDEEREACRELERTSVQGNEEKIEPPSPTSVVGKKRTMDFGTCGY